MTQTTQPDDPAPSVTRRAALRRSWANVKLLMAGRMYRLWILSAASILGGFTEAGVLYLVVRIAIALAAGETTVNFALGPVRDLTLTLSGTLLVAVCAVLVLSALSMVETVVSARMSADVLTATRKGLFADFIRASWSVQSMEQEGQLQEYMSTYVGRVAQSIYVFTGGFISGFNFLALLVSAIIVD